MVDFYVIDSRLMNFDYNSNSRETFVANPLFAYPNRHVDNYFEVVATCIKNGIEPEKIVLQINAFGRSYELEDSRKNEVFANIQRLTRKENRLNDYISEVVFNKVCHLSSKWHRSFDQDSFTNYLSFDKSWITIEDLSSVSFKLRWFKSQTFQIAGISLLSFTHDDYGGLCFNGIRFPLSKIIACEFRNLYENETFCSEAATLLKIDSRQNDRELYLEQHKNSLFYSIPYLINDTNSLYKEDFIIKLGSETQERIYCQTGYLWSNWVTRPSNVYRPNYDPISQIKNHDIELAIPINALETFDKNDNHSNQNFLLLTNHFHGLTWTLIVATNLYGNPIELQLKCFMRCRSEKWSVNAYVTLYILFEQSRSALAANFTRTFRYNSDIVIAEHRFYVAFNEIEDSEGFIKNQTITILARIWADLPKGLNQIDTNEYPGCKALNEDGSLNPLYGEAGVIRTIHFLKDKSLISELGNFTLEETLEFIF